MGTEDGAQVRALLSKRHAVLESLLEGPKTKPTLVAELDDSRSTVDRAVSELLDGGCIEPTAVAGGRYRITLTGKTLLQTYREYCADTEAIRSAGSLLNALPQDTAIDRSFITDSEVHASEKIPDVALQPAVDLLPDATKLIGTAPVIFSDYFDLLDDWIRESQSELELVLEADLLDSIEGNYDAELSSFRDSDSVDLYVLDDRIPYALWVIEHDPAVRAGITVYNDGGIAGSLVATTDRAVKWARDRYSRYKTAASRVA